jgi:hypothetical protein
MQTPAGILQPLGPSLSGNTIQCVWCNTEIGRPESDGSVVFDTEGMDDDQPGPETNDTEDGTKINIPCPDCGKDNVLLAQVTGQ